MNAADDRTRYDDLLDGFARGELSLSESAEFDGILARQPAWRADAEEERALVAMMRSAPRAKAPAGLAAAVLAELGAADVVDLSTREVARPRVPFAQRLLPLAAVLAMGAMGYVLIQPVPPPRAEEKPASAIMRMTASPATGGGRAPERLAAEDGSPVNEVQAQASDKGVELDAAIGAKDIKMTTMNGVALGVAASSPPAPPMAPSFSEEESDLLSQLAGEVKGASAASQDPATLVFNFPSEREAIAFVAMLSVDEESARQLSSARAEQFGRDDEAPRENAFAAAKTKKEDRGAAGGKRAAEAAASPRPAPPPIVAETERLPDGTMRVVLRRRP